MLAVSRSNYDDKTARPPSSPPPPQEGNREHGCSGRIEAWRRASTGRREQHSSNKETGEVGGALARPSPGPRHASPPDVALHGMCLLGDGEARYAEHISPGGWLGPRPFLRLGLGRAGGGLLLPRTLNTSSPVPRRRQAVQHIQAPPTSASSGTDILS